MARGRIPTDDGERALARYRDDPEALVANLPELALAVRYTLQLLSQSAPGRSVEVRVPPFAAVQVIDGPAHTRGTPPAVVETTAAVWLDLALGKIDYQGALNEGLVQASGLRADLQQFLPLRPLG